MDKYHYMPYKRKGTIEARPYFAGEDLIGISVSEADKGKQNGMIARNPDNHDDKWFIDMDYFRKHYE